MRSEMDTLARKKVVTFHQLVTGHENQFSFALDPIPSTLDRSNNNEINATNSGY